MTFFRAFLFLFVFSQPLMAQSDSLKNQSFFLQHGNKYKGKVKSVSLFEKYRHHDDHNYPYIFRLKTLTFLNELGYIIERKTWEENDSVLFHVLYNYWVNQTTYLGSEVLFRLRPPRPISYATVTDYAWPNPTTKLEIDGNTNRVLYKIEYYPSEVRKKLTCYGPDTTTIDRIDLYDSLGNTLSSESWAYDIHTLEKWTYIYDDRGNVLEKIKPGADGSYIYHTIYAYNDLNQKIKEECISIYEHRVENYVYNEHGDLVEMTLKRSEENWSGLMTYVYTYDDHDNWISCTRFWKGKDVFKAVREFTYY